MASRFILGTVLTSAPEGVPAGAGAGQKNQTKKSVKLFGLYHLIHSL